MEPARYDLIRRVFLAARGLSGAARERYLDDACRNDPSLRAEAETYLASDEAANGFLEHPVFVGATLSEATGPGGSGPGATSESARLNDRSGRAGAAGGDAVPERLGGYRIIRELGRGGMGSVLLGVQEEGAITRTVAIKLVKRGMDTEEILHRFEVERRVLSALNHPNIARVFDADTAPDGRPYFVMEYVEGLPIDAYCNSNELSIGDRLRLFTKVCSAVHAAHQNLVVQSRSDGQIERGAAVRSSDVWCQRSGRDWPVSGRGGPARRRGTR